jgi:hypothetical protein
MGLKSPSSIFSFTRHGLTHKIKRESFFFHIYESKLNSCTFHGKKTHQNEMEYTLLKGKLVL